MNTFIQYLEYYSYSYLNNEGSDISYSLEKLPIHLTFILIRIFHILGFYVLRAKLIWATRPHVSRLIPEI